MSVAPRAKGKLTLTVHEGKELTNKDVGKQDPFCKIKLGEESFKTKTHKKGGTEPRWKQTFLFNVKDYDLKEQVHFEVWDEDTFSNDKIGLVSVPLDTLVKEAHNDDGYWYQIHAFGDRREIAGYIRISVVFEGHGFHGSSSHPIAKKLEEKLDVLKHKHEEEQHHKEEEAKKREAEEERKRKIKEEEDARRRKEEEQEEAKKKYHESHKKHHHHGELQGFGDDKKTEHFHGHETRVQAKHSGLFCDISGASNDNGAEVIQWEGHTGTNQIFIFIDRKDGTYEIAAKHSGKLLTPEKNADSAKIAQQSRTGDESQRWLLKHHGDGSFRISNFVGGRSFDVQGNSKAKGAHVQQYPPHEHANQKFVLEKSFGSFYTTPRHGLETRIQAKHSGMFLDINGASHDDGAKLIQWSGHSGANQVFVFHDRKDGTVEIVAKHSGKLLTISSHGKMVQHSRSGDHQRWLLKHIGPKTYQIINLGSGKALDISGAAKNEGADAIVWDVHEHDNQKFILESE